MNQYLQSMAKNNLPIDFTNIFPCGKIWGQSMGLFKFFISFF